MTSVEEKKCDTSVRSDSFIDSICHYCDMKMLVDHLVFTISALILVRSFPLRNDSFITNDEEFIPSYEWKPVKEGKNRSESNFEV